MKAIKVKKLYDGSIKKPLENAIVVFDETGIADVLRAGEEAKLARYNAQLEDLSDMYMTPGLIDAHVHVHERGIGFEPCSIFEQMAEGEVQIMAYDNCMTALRHGVTTLRDCGSERDISIHTRNYIDRTGVGPDLLVCGGGICTTAGHGYTPENAVDGPDEICARIRQLQGKHVDFIKLLSTTEVWPRKAGRVIGFTYEELKAAIDEAHRLNFKVTNHATFTDLIRLLVDLGADGIEHCMFANSNWSKLDLDPRLCEDMLKKGVMPSHTMAVSVCYLDHLLRKEKAGTLTPAEKAAISGQKARKEQVLEQFNFQINQGLPSIASSDSGFEFSGWDHAMALTLETMVEGGMNNRTAIYSATGLPAQHFGLGEKLGMVRPGLQADLVLLDQDPGENISAYRKVQRVYKRGVLVK